MCCKNSNLVVRSSENDLELFKKDITRSKAGNSKAIHQDTDDEKYKYKRNKEILDKHVRDNSFKLNSSTSKLDYTKRIAELSEAVKKSDLLSLKVNISNLRQLLNSCSDMAKGTEILINCRGLVSPSHRDAGDGFVYFGNIDEFSQKYMIDFEIPFPKTVTNNDTSNMYIAILK